MPTLRTLFSAAASSLTLLVAQPGLAQDAYPSKPIKIIVALPAGGSVDMVARLIGQQLSVDLGQPVLIDNRAGASGQIGLPAVAKAPPDGYTLTVSPASFLTTNKSLFKTLPYDPEKDFTPITKLVNQAMVMVVPEKSRFATVADVVAAAKAKPGTLTFASSGDGSPQHLAGLMLQSRAGIQLLHVPYKGGAPAITDLMAGTVDLVFAPLPEALPHIKAGKLHPVGVLSEKRSPILPDVPTLREGGVDGLVLSAWIGVLAPARTPPAIVERLNKAVRAVLTGDARAKLVDLGMEPALDDAKSLKQTISDDIRIHAELVRAAGLVPQ